MYWPPQDRVFQIEITTQCNLKCAGCSRTVGVNAHNWKNQHMSVEAFRTAVMNARPAQAIILQGIGEPTLHPNFPELISIAKESDKFHTISFYTNALARSIEYYDDLQRRGNNLLTVSVDSLNQSIADICREGTDVQKLLKRLCELYYTYSPNMNISLVLSRKNLLDCFETLKTLNAIASAGTEYITVFVQKMYATSDEIKRDYVLRPEDVELFRSKMREMKKLYPKLRLGLCGDLNIAETPPVEPAASAAPHAITLCDKTYLDRFVTIDGFLTPCCVMTDKDEWRETKLDRPLVDVFMTQNTITSWYENYQKSGHKNCANCGLMSPIDRKLITGLPMAESA